MNRAVLLAAILSLPAVLQAGDRALPFRPLEGAKAGAVARYTGTIADASGKVVDTYPLVVEVLEAAADEDVRLAITQRAAKKERALPPDADAKDVIAALRLLPPGTPIDSLRAAPAKAKVGGKEVDATRVTIEATVAGGAAKVTLEALFAAPAGPLGLVSAKTVVSGGGAGISTLALEP